MSDTYNVIVIGSAGGGTPVRPLAPSGKRSLLLERGDWLTREPQVEGIDVRSPESGLAHVA